MTDTITLNEQQLRAIISEGIKRTLKEASEDENFKGFMKGLGGAFKGAKQGETATLLRLDADTISKHKGVDQVKVLTLYETCAYRNPLVQYFYDWTEEATIDFR